MSTRILALALALTGVACGGEEHGAEACAAAQSGTPTPLDARTATVTVSLAAEPFEITLPAGGRGHARLTVATDTAIIVALETTGVPISVSGPAAVSLGAAEPVEACPSDVPAHHDLDLPVAGDYVFALGPVAGDRVWLFLHEAEHEH